jgi:hypothetical protein
MPAAHDGPATTSCNTQAPQARSSTGGRLLLGRMTAAAGVCSVWGAQPISRHDTSSAPPARSQWPGRHQCNKLDCHEQGAGVAWHAGTTPSRSSQQGTAPRTTLPAHTHDGAFP